MRSLSRLLVFAAVAVVTAIAPGCTKPNPAVCCLDSADCAEVGISEVRTCADGLACVEHQCVVPSCSTAGCAASAPVCNITTDTCDGCTDSAECARFPDTPVCEPTSGGCVQCVADAECPATQPICDANACRACQADSECPSGACGEDGACVPEDAIVYLDAGGTDTGTCPRTAPCRTIEFAVSRTSATRSHIVMSPGGYTEEGIYIMPQDTAAARLYVHGGGAILSTDGSGDSDLITSFVPLAIRDLRLVTEIGRNALTLQAATSLKNVEVSGANVGVSASASLQAQDLLVEDSFMGIGIGSTGVLDLDRAVLRRNTQGLVAEDGATLEISNLLAHSMFGLALDVHGAAGTISFSTIADSGMDSGTGPRAVFCSNQLTVRSSIIWAPGLTPRVSMQGCNVLNSIAGPTPVPGALNSDPQFVDSANKDYHLAPTSPARDMVDTGPATDFEGDPRPQGARFDIGADEAAR